MSYLFNLWKILWYYVQSEPTLNSTSSGPERVNSTHHSEHKQSLSFQKNKKKRKKKKDTPYKHFQSQGPGHRDEHENICHA